MKKNKTKFRLKKILFSVIGVFVFAFSFALTNFNFAPVEAQAQVLNNYTPLVPVDNTIFYSRYDLLEYVSNNGSAYINTGYNPSTNTYVRADFIDNSSVNSYKCLFGVRTDSGNGWVNFYSYYDVANGSVTRKVLDFKRTNTSSTYFNIPTSNIGIRSTFVMGGGFAELTYNNSSYNVTFSSSSFTSSRPFYLCALNEVDGSANDTGNFRIYSFNLYEGSYANPVRSFVPARQKSNGLVGLYDLVNNRFYSSANNNNFVAGPQVYTVNFYNGSTLYQTQNFTSKSDFVSPEAPSVPTGSTFLGWSLSNDNNIESVVDTTTLVNNYTQPLNFYSVIVNDDYLAGYNYAKNLYDGFGIFQYSSFIVLEGTTPISSLSGRVTSSLFTGYNGGVLLEGGIQSLIESYESDNEIQTTDIRFIFDTPIPVSKYTNFIFNNSFEFGNSATFYFNDGTSYEFAQDDDLGNFIDLTSYNTKFIAYIDIGWAASFGDYGIGLGFSANPSYLNSYNNGFTEGKDVGYKTGYTEGYSQGSSNGYNRGYNLGLEAGNNYSFFGLVAAVIDAPIQAFTGLFDFEIFGTNLRSLFLALFTACVVIVVVKLCLGGK